MMKKILGLTLVAMIGVGAAFAGDGCCMSKAGVKAGGSCEMTAKLNLTDAQKIKLTALQERCQRAVSTSERRAMFQKGIEEILTPEQLAQCKASGESAKPTGKCPFMSDKKS